MCCWSPCATTTITPVGAHPTRTTRTRMVERGRLTACRPPCLPWTLPWPIIPAPGFSPTAPARVRLARLTCRMPMPRRALYLTAIVADSWQYTRRTFEMHETLVGVEGYVFNEGSDLRGDGMDENRFPLRGAGHLPRGGHRGRLGRGAEHVHQSARKILVAGATAMAYYGQFPRQKLRV